MLILLPLGAAAAALAGATAFITSDPRPVDRIAVVQKAAPATPVAVAPSVTAEAARPAAAAPAKPARTRAAKPAKAPHKGQIAQATPAAPQAVAEPTPKRPRIRDAFRRKKEVAARDLSGEGPRGEGTGFDNWFYKQRAFPADHIPEGALSRALAHAEEHNGGLR